MFACCTSRDFAIRFRSRAWFGPRRYRCYETAGQVHLRAYRAASLWVKGRKKQQVSVEWIATTHGGSVVWGGLRCEWRCPQLELLLARDITVSTPVCTGNTQQAQAHLHALKQWVGRCNSRPRNAEEEMHGRCFSILLDTENIASFAATRFLEPTALTTKTIACAYSVDSCLQG